MPTISARRNMERGERALKQNRSLQKLDFAG